MPDGLAETLEIDEFIETNFPLTPTSTVMPQYHPSGDIGGMKSLRRQITPPEAKAQGGFSIRSGWRG